MNAAYTKLTHKQQVVYDCITGSVTADDIAEITGYSSAAVHSLLSALWIKKRVDKYFGKPSKYSRVIII